MISTTHKLLYFRRWRRPVRRALVVLVSAFAIAVLGLSIRYMGSPAVGIIDRARVMALAPAPLNMAPATVVDPYMTFTYPEGLSHRAPQPAQGTVLASYRFFRYDSQPWNLAITVQNLASASLESNSSYQFRMLHPERFSQSVLSVDGQAVPVMTDNAAGGYAKVAFLTHGSRQATVSLTGDDPQGDESLQATLLMVLDSWRWR